MALSPAQRLARTYAGPIAAAVSQRATTAQIWDAIRSAAAASGTGAPLPSIGAVNELRSLFSAARNATETIAAARATEIRTGLPQSITGSMTSLGLNSRPVEALQTAADYIVRFERQTIDPLGNTISKWVSAKYPAGALPATVGDLVDALSTFKPGTGTPQLGNFTGIGSISITAV